MSGALDDEVSVVGRRRLRNLRQKVRQVLVETSFGGHAGCPPGMGDAVAMVDGENKDVVIVAGGGNGMLELFVRPELKSYDDIRGKSVVVDAPVVPKRFAPYLAAPSAVRSFAEGHSDLRLGGWSARAAR